MSDEQYPSWRYHKSKAPVVVKDADQDAALGSGWADTPEAHEPGFVRSAAPAEVAASLEAENADLKRQLEALTAKAKKKGVPAEP